MTVVEPRGTLGTVRNAVLLLDLLSEGPAFQQLTDLAERSRLTIPTVHRLLRSLVLADLVEQEPSSARYGLGPEVTRLSQRYLARLPILRALSPYLIQLRDGVGATVHVALLVRSSVVYVDSVDGPEGGLYRDSHRVHSALATAAGRILAARAGGTAWQQALDAATPDERVLAEAEGDSWRCATHLVSSGNSLAVLPELAVPALDGSARAIAALAAGLPRGATEHDVDVLVAELRRAAMAAGRTLGHE